MQFQKKKNLVCQFKAFILLLFVYIEDHWCLAIWFMIFLYNWSLFLLLIHIDEKANICVDRYFSCRAALIGQKACFKN
jgi:hypothetical protein